MYRNFTVLVIYKCLFYNSLKCILYALVRLLKIRSISVEYKTYKSIDITRFEEL